MKFQIVSIDISYAKPLNMFFWKPYFMSRINFKIKEIEVTQQNIKTPLKICFRL